MRRPQFTLRALLVTPAAANNELLTLKLRYKKPGSQTSEPAMTFTVRDSEAGFAKASADFRFAAAAAGFGLILRDSQFKGNLTYDAVLELAQTAMGDDPRDRRAEFAEMVRKAKAFAGFSPKGR